jgi:predicted hotdog family 3-hydroxylacyl-ACP dehydratase
MPKEYSFCSVPPEHKITEYVLTGPQEDHIPHQNTPGMAKTVPHLMAMDDVLNLEELLPHRPPMLLIDRVVEVNAVYALTLSRVAQTWPMAEEHGVASLILVELAAQTAGVCNGWERIRRRGIDSERTGWLVAVKRAEFRVSQLPFGMQLTTRAENTLEFDTFREVTSQVFDNDRLIAEVVLQLYQP